MLSLPQPEVILTHESDLDGFVSGLLLQRLAKLLYNVTVPLEAHHYHSWRQRELREKCAWVSDFTFEQRLDRPNWIVVDHHPAEAPAKQATLVHDLTRSAGLIVYDLCRERGIESAELTRLVTYNNVSDLFLEDAPEFVLANDYANLVKSYGFWNLHALIDSQLERLLDHPLLEVMDIKRRVEDPLGLEWSSKNIVQITPTLGYVDTVVGNNNLIVHQLLERGSAFPILMTLLRKGNGVIVASLRSRGGEALKIAEALKGGGHPNACGATLPRSVRTIPDAISYLRNLLNPPIPANDQLNSLAGIFESLETKPA